MHASLSKLSRRSLPGSPDALLPAVLLAVLVTACGGSSGGGGQSGIVGQEGTKPGGASFIVDENQSGGAASLHLAEVLWGRLVDVHQIDANGERVDPPVYTDFVINPFLETDNVRWVLERNPLTQRERLVILNTKGPDPLDSPPTEDKFLTILREADSLLLVADKNDDGTSAPPFTTVPRNACMVLRFDDCLDDDAEASKDLVTAGSATVEVFTGYPPSTPYTTRVVFDPNHGALIRGSFHSTRVLVDLTTSDFEAAALPVVVEPNSVGLPPRLDDSDAPNVSVRIPSQDDLGSGQFRVLTNLKGRPLDLQDNGPVDVNSVTQDVVRAVKAGNNDDDSNGFLVDREKPFVIGNWPATISDAADNGAGEDGFDFLVDLHFQSTCAVAPVAGDLVRSGDNLLQVTSAGILTGSDVLNLQVRSLTEVDVPGVLDGECRFHTPFSSTSPVVSGCWLNFVPEPLVFPTGGITTTAQVLIQFSEPMDPDTLSAFGGFLVVHGGGGAASTAISSNIVVGEVHPNSSLTLFSFEPNAPFSHTAGSATDTFHVELGVRNPDDELRKPGIVKDLAGNPYRFMTDFPFVNFAIAAAQPAESNRAIVMRFDASDETDRDTTTDSDPFGDAPDPNALRVDLRGQFFYDDRGAIMGRPVAFNGWPVDRNNPVPSRMAPPGLPVIEPLVRLGAKLQTVWRYCDMGWDARDETKYNLDVIGINWSPVAGLVTADFYPQFEILLGHSRFLPDEAINPTTGLPYSPTSGLPTTLFEGNYLAGAGPTVVHNRALGYSVDPATQFNSTSPTMTPMIPFPLNRGLGTDVTYTWRDTAILAKGADGDPAQRGVPLLIEQQAGVMPLANPGSLGAALQVPTFGLPLLMEFRCHSSDIALGFNTFNYGLANGFAFGTGIIVPTFRAYSAGGTSGSGSPLKVLPDAEDFPRGLLGSALPVVVDNDFYFGQLDTVVRVSRVHSAWLDAGDAISVNPSWRPAVLEPSLAEQPLGTNILIDYRGATGFSTTSVNAFDAALMNAYGEVTGSGAPQPQQLTDWSNDIRIANGKRFIQLRITFVNNIDTGVGPRLTGLALPYDIQ